MRCVFFAEELRTAHDGFVMLCCTVWLPGLRCSHHGLVVLCSTAWLADNCWAQIEMITIRRLWRCSPPSGSLRFDDGHDGHDSEFGCRAIGISPIPIHALVSQAGIHMHNSHPPRVQTKDKRPPRGRVRVLHHKHGERTFPRRPGDELNLSHGGDAQESALERNHEVRDAVRRGAGRTCCRQATRFTAPRTLAAGSRRGLHRSLAAERA